MRQPESQRPQRPFATYAEAASKLAPLESFDPSAFVARDDAATQAACDFVLALALVFNDVQNLLMAYSLFLPQAPADGIGLTPERGKFNGTELQLYRMLVATLQELFYLVSTKPKARRSPAFVRAVKQLPREYRETWTTILDVAEKKDVIRGTDPDREFLTIVRNNVSFHYGPKALRVAFDAAFPFAATPGAEPLVSRGDRIPEARFYFADRAAQKAIEQWLGDEDLHQYFFRREQQLRQIAGTLYFLVVRFVESRGCAWRTPLQSAQEIPR
ncbi:MAG: hypothetical protein WA208_15890 [Thermoanaerobaculia bacterium]